jgi:hypothetical protein
MGYTSAVRKCIHVEIRNKFNLIHEKDWTGDTVSIICNLRRKLDLELIFLLIDKFVIYL